MTCTPRLLSVSAVWLPCVSPVGVGGSGRKMREKGHRKSQGQFGRLTRHSIQSEMEEEAEGQWAIISSGGRRGSLALGDPDSPPTSLHRALVGSNWILDDSSPMSGARVGGQTQLDPGYKDWL